MTTHLKRKTALPFIFILLAFALSSGCARSSEKSDLLSLLGVDEGVAHTSSQEIGTIYDALSLLKRGEAHYIAKDYTEAIEEYRRFLDLYPIHRMAPFSQYRIGMAHYRQINSPDRDPGPIEQAIASFKKLLTGYPESLYAEEAREKVAELISRQAEHHLYVGRFYFKRRAYPAAIARLNVALGKGGDGPVAEETLYYLGRSHYASGNQDQAGDIFLRLLKEYPSSSYSKKVRKMFPTYGYLSPS